MGALRVVALAAAVERRARRGEPATGLDALVREVEAAVTGLHHELLAKAQD